MQEKCAKMQLTAFDTETAPLLTVLLHGCLCTTELFLFPPSSLTEFSISSRKLKLEIWFRTSSVRLNQFPLKSSKFPSMFGISRAYVCLDLQPLKWDGHWMSVLFLRTKHTKQPGRYHLPDDHTVLYHALAKPLSTYMNLLQYFSYSEKARLHPEKRHSLLLPLVNQSHSFWLQSVWAVQISFVLKPRTPTAVEP